jgi:type IV secretory pathway TrbL component
MQGPPRRKGNTDYLQFKPYRAIVAPHLSKRRTEGVLSAAVKSGLIAVLILGIPTALVVLIFTYFTNEFVTLQHFAAHAAKNMLLPLLVIAGIGFCAGVVSLVRR